MRRRRLIDHAPPPHLHQNRLARRHRPLVRPGSAGPGQARVGQRTDEPHRSRRRRGADVPHIHTARRHGHRLQIDVGAHEGRGLELQRENAVRVPERADLRRPGPSHLDLSHQPQMHGLIHAQHIRARVCEDRAEPLHRLGVLGMVPRLDVALDREGPALEPHIAHDPTVGGVPGDGATRGRARVRPPVDRGGQPVQAGPRRHHVAEGHDRARLRGGVPVTAHTHRIILLPVGRPARGRRAASESWTRVRPRRRSGR